MDCQIDYHECVPGKILIIDYNGPVALKNAGLEKRSYPRIFPVPDTVLQVGGELDLSESLNRIRLYPEISVIIDENIKSGKQIDIDKELIYGYRLGLAFWTDSLLQQCHQPTERDVIVNTIYGHYSDNSRIQSNKIVNYQDITSLKQTQLSLQINDVPVLKTDMDDMIFDGIKVIDRMNRMLPFKKGDLICLGCVGESLIYDNLQDLDSSIIKLSGPPFPDLNIPVKYCN